MKAELVLASFDAAAEAGRPYRVSHGEATAIRALIAERDKYREWAADALPFMAKAIAAHSSFDSRHIIARHYDMMVEAGCDMDDLVRREP